MKQNSILLLFLLPTITAAAQTDTNAPGKIKGGCIATIFTMEGRKTKGWFYKMDSNNVYLLPTQKEKIQPVDIKNIDPVDGSFSIQASQINTITLKKKNAALKGALIGFATGALIVGVIGFISQSDPNPSQTLPNNWFANYSTTSAPEENKTSKFLIGGVTGALAGGLIGALVKKKFIIGGKKDVYRDLNSELMQKLIIK